MEDSGARLFDKLFSRPDLSTSVSRLEGQTRAYFTVALAWQAAAKGDRQTAFDFLAKAMKYRLSIMASPLFVKVGLEAIAGHRGRVLWNSLRNLGPTAEASPGQDTD